MTLEENLTKINEEHRRSLTKEEGKEKTREELTKIITANLGPVDIISRRNQLITTLQISYTGQIVIVIPDYSSEEWIMKEYPNQRLFNKKSFVLEFRPYIQIPEMPHEFNLPEGYFFTTAQKDRRWAIRNPSMFLWNFSGHGKLRFEPDGGHGDFNQNGDEEWTYSLDMHVAVGDRKISTLKVAPYQLKKGVLNAFFQHMQLAL